MTTSAYAIGDVSVAGEAARDLLHDVRKLRGYGHDLFMSYVSEGPSWLEVANRLPTKVAVARDTIEPLLAALDKTLDGRGNSECGHLCALSAHGLTVQLGEHAEGCLLTVMHGREVAEGRFIPPWLREHDANSTGNTPTSLDGEFAELRKMIRERLGENRFDLSGADWPAVQRTFGAIPMPELVEWNRVLAQLEAETRALKAIAGKPQGRRTKREATGESLVRGALVTWHKYDDGQIDNHEPITMDDLVATSEQSKPTVSRALKSKFGGYKQYKTACARETLAAALAFWNGDVTEEHIKQLRPDDLDDE